jgi:hypothetical protein
MVHDQLATGRKLRVLTIVDTFSRFSPAVEPRFNFRGADVVDRARERFCCPRASPGKKSRSGLQSACDELIDKGAIITGE